MNDHNVRNLVNSVEKVAFQKGHEIYFRSVPHIWNYDSKERISGFNSIH